MDKIKTFQVTGKKTHISKNGWGFGSINSICGFVSHDRFDRDERIESFENVDCERCKKIYMKNKSMKGGHAAENNLLRISNNEKGKIIDELTEKIRKQHWRIDKLLWDVNMGETRLNSVTRDHDLNLKFKRDTEINMQYKIRENAKLQTENSKLKGIIEAIKKVTEIA